MNKPIKVSIIITTYNEEKHIKNILKSISEQTYKYIETIVVDDGSVDDTTSIARSYKKTKVYSRTHSERSVQRNFGAKVANGKYLLFLDCDMILTPNVISECVEVSTKTNSRSIIIPENSFGIGYWASVKALERSWYLGDDNIEAERFFEKTLFKTVGGFNESITGPEDWDLPRRTRKISTPERIKGLILHNEGRQSFWRMIKKKYYYAKKLSLYLSSHNIPAIGNQQVYFLRPSIYKNIFKIWIDPKLYLGVWLLLISQTISGGVGYIIGKWQNKT